MLTTIRRRIRGRSSKPPQTFQTFFKEKGQNPRPISYKKDASYIKCSKKRPTFLKFFNQGPYLHLIYLEDPDRECNLFLYMYTSVHTIFFAESNHIQWSS